MDKYNIKNYKIIKLKDSGKYVLKLTPFERLFEASSGAYLSISSYFGYPHLQDRRFATKMDKKTLDYILKNIFKVKLKVRG